MAVGTKGRFVQREKRYGLGRDFMDVDIVGAFHIPGGRGRKKKEKETCPAQKNLNDERSRLYFVRLVLANFGEGDYRLDLTYNRESVPGTAEELAKNGRNMIRRLKNAFRKAGRELRYVLVNAWGVKKETGEIVRPHHHLIISGGVSAEEVMKVWQNRRGESYGYVSYCPLQPDRHTGIVGLATYLAEQPTAGVRRWTGSQNLAHPEFSVNDSRYSRRKVARLIMSESFRAYGAECAKLISYDAWNREYPGWRLVGYDPRWNEDVGAWHIGLRFRRLV